MRENSMRGKILWTWTEPIWTERPLDGRSVAWTDGDWLGRSALDDGRTEPDSQAPKRSVQTSAPSVHGRWTDGAEFSGAENGLDGRSSALDRWSLGLDGQSDGLDGADLDGASIGRTEVEFGRTVLSLDVAPGRSWFWTERPLDGRSVDLDGAVLDGAGFGWLRPF
eukprot:gene14339-biopygen6607